MNMRKNFCALLVAASLLFASATNSSALITGAGDVDGDGVVRLADALAVLRHVAGIESLTFIQLYACDVSGSGFPLPSRDGVCDITDAVMILNKAYGLIIF